ncbi:MAG: hypothetical protein ACMUJM_15100 [bacterium]
MNEKIICAVQNKIEYFDGECWKLLTSQYLDKYIANRIALQRKNEWKTKGFHAAFRGDFDYSHALDADTMHNQASITGLAFINQGKEVIYSVTIENNSGLFRKSLMDNIEVEGHILHNANIAISNLDYNEKSDEIVFSIQNEKGEKNLAKMHSTGACYQEITEGDSMDDNPIWDHEDSHIIYYETSGIIRDYNGMIINYGPKAINRLNLKTAEVDEFISHPDYDYFDPKIDKVGNLYCIQKPYKSLMGNSLSLKDTLLIPCKLLKAIFNWIEFFTIRNTGAPLTSGGPTVAKSQNDLKQIIINNNIINAEKIIKENMLKGEKYPGFAPRNWELVKYDREGNCSLVKKGVIDYDIIGMGEAIISNGKYLLKIDQNFNAVEIKKMDFVSKVKIYP